MNAPKRILIVRTDRIGDVVLSLPLASVIKKHYPDAHVSFLLKDYTKALAQNSSHIDEVIVLKEKDGSESISENISLLKNKYDICIVAFPTFKIALILWLANIKIRIGSGYRLYSFLFNKKVYVHRKRGEKHELEYNIQLLTDMGIKENVNHENVSFGLSADSDSKNVINNFLLANNIDDSKKIVIVHPGSGGSAIDLPVDKMRSLIEHVSKIKNIVLLITGSSKEKELCGSMVVNSLVINCAGMFSLKELMALIDKSNLLIANSTGPIHIAAALGKKVIGFYPKFDAVKPERWGPYTNKASLFQPNICGEICSRETCEKLNCMNSINIDDVVKTVNHLLEN